MKEATGELNMTVVTVVAIAAVAAFFYAFVWPGIKSSITRNTHCANANVCTDCNGKTCKCTYIDESDKSKDVICPDNNGTTTTAK
jgi:hypothetical protein